MFQENLSATATSATSATSTADPLEQRFGAGHQLPRGLREEAAGMSWALFSAVYCPSPKIRVSHLESEKLRGGTFRFTGEITEVSKTRAPQSHTLEVEATGAVSALTHMLAANGRYVEILTFRQKQIFEATVTFVEVAHQNNHRRTAWAVGFGPTAESSTAAALTSGAYRIHG